MSQSSFIGAMLLAGFVLYLAANNRLATYAAVLWGPTNSPLPVIPIAGPAPASPPASGPAPTPYNGEPWWQKLVDQASKPPAAEPPLLSPGGIAGLLELLP